MKSKRVRDALVSLDGMFFDTKDAVEDAIFPLYGQLQDLFLGEGHRNLVDRLISARWLDFTKGKWQLILPALDKFDSTPEQPELNPSREIDDQIDNQPILVSRTRKDAVLAAVISDDYREAIRILALML